MDDPASPSLHPVPNLRVALRTARAEEAERSDALGDLRDAEFARLHILRDAIEPVLAQVPDDVDLFDVGLMPGHRPRLFIDMIAFVEMAHDRRTYRFVQDRRHGRVILAESERADDIGEAVAAYVARRLVDRAKALASDPDATPPAVPAMPVAAVPTASVAEAAPTRGRVGLVFRIVLEYLGIVALCVILWMLARYGLEVWQSHGLLAG